MNASVRRYSRLALGLILLSVPVAREASGQSFERATLQGTITDTQGGALPGVSVTIRSLDTNLERILETGPDGRFAAPGLQPGGYEVKATLTGFKTALHPEVRLLVGQTVSVDLMLELGTIAEEVTVTGGAPLIDTTKTDFSKVVDAVQIDNLPINGRNFLDFATLTPAVVFNTSTAISGIGANVAGARSRNGNVMVDGYNNLDDSFTAPRLIFSQEAIQEFQVLTLGYPAEFGRATGGIVNAITKSGANVLNGRGFYFFRDKVLNARNAFEPEDTEKAGFRRQQWGGTVGGPLRRDKLFFFGSLERQDLTVPRIVTITPVNAAVAGIPPDQLGSHDEIDDYWSMLGKFNFNQSNNSFYEVLIAHSRETLTRLGGGLQTPSGGTLRQTYDYLYGFKWSRLFGDGRLLNELRVSYNPRDFTNDGLGEGPRVAISGVATFGIATNVPNIAYTEQGQIIDTLSYTAGQHDLKVGMDLYPVHQDKDSSFGFFGSYTFGSLANFQRGVYTRYTQTFGQTKIPIDHGFYAFFAQDVYRVHRRLTLNYGLRYEFEKQPKVDGIQYPEDTNNWGPRAGFSFDLTGAGKTLLRGNVGKFYDKNFINIHLNTFQALGGVRQRTYAFNSPTEPFAPQYPAVLAQEPAVTGSRDTRLMVEDPSIPEAWQWSMEVTTALGDKTSATVSFLRNRQWHQYVNLVDNRITLIDGVRRRPDPTVGAVSVYAPEGISSYKALIFEMTRRLADGVQVSGNYTYAKSLADSNDFGSTYIDENNRRLDYGAAPDDVRHNFSINGQYTVPTTSLAIAGIYRYTSARPYSAMAGSDLNGDGVQNDRAPGYEDQPFSFRGDSFQRFDLRVSYRFDLGGKRRLDLIGEIFNLFNTTNYLEINTTWGTTAVARDTFGDPLTAADPRVSQIGVRFLF